MIAKLPAFIFLSCHSRLQKCHSRESGNPEKDEARVKGRGLIHQARNKDGSDKSDPYKKKDVESIKENIK